MKIKDFIAQTLLNAKTKIVETVNSQLENEEKKSSVDDAITIWVDENSLKLSPVQRFVVTKALIPIIPTITQIIYDCLKEKVEGLTNG